MAGASPGASQPPAHPALVPGGSKAVTASTKKLLTSVYRGVCWNRKNYRWQASLNNIGRYIYLGSYKTQEEAASAFDRAALRLRGARARLNFARSSYLDPATGDLLPDPEMDKLLAGAMNPALKPMGKRLRISLTSAIPPRLAAGMEAVAAVAAEAAAQAAAAVGIMSVGGGGGTGGTVSAPTGAGDLAGSSEDDQPLVQPGRARMAAFVSSLPQEQQDSLHGHLSASQWSVPSAAGTALGGAAARTAAARLTSARLSMTGSPRNPGGGGHVSGGSGGGKAGAHAGTAPPPPSALAHPSTLYAQGLMHYPAALPPVPALGLWGLPAAAGPAVPSHQPLPLGHHDSSSPPPASGLLHPSPAARSNPGGPHPHDSQLPELMLHGAHLKPSGAPRLQPLPGDKAVAAAAAGVRAALHPYAAGLLLSAPEPGQQHTSPALEGWPGWLRPQQALACVGSVSNTSPLRGGQDAAAPHWAGAGAARSDEAAELPQASRAPQAQQAQALLLRRQQELGASGGSNGGVSGGAHCPSVEIAGGGPPVHWPHTALQQLQAHSLAVTLATQQQQPAQRGSQGPGSVRVTQAVSSPCSSTQASPSQVVVLTPGMHMPHMAVPPPPPDNEAHASAGGSGAMLALDVPPQAPPLCCRSLHEAPGAAPPQPQVAVPPPQAPGVLMTEGSQALMGIMPGPMMMVVPPGVSAQAMLTAHAQAAAGVSPHHQLVQLQEQGQLLPAPPTGGGYAVHRLQGTPPWHLAASTMSGSTDDSGLQAPHVVLVGSHGGGGTPHAMQLPSHVLVQLQATSLQQQVAGVPQLALMEGTTAHRHLQQQQQQQQQPWMLQASATPSGSLASPDTMHQLEPHVHAGKPPLQPSPSQPLVPRSTSGKLAPSGGPPSAPSGVMPSQASGSGTSGAGLAVAPWAMNQQRSLTDSSSNSHLGGARAAAVALSVHHQWRNSTGGGALSPGVGRTSLPGWGTLQGPVALEVPLRGQVSNNGSTTGPGTASAPPWVWAPPLRGVLEPYPPHPPHPLPTRRVSAAGAGTLPALKDPHSEGGGAAAAPRLELPVVPDSPFVPPSAPAASAPPSAPASTSGVEPTLGTTRSFVFPRVAGWSLDGTATPNGALGASVGHTPLLHSAEPPSLRPAGQPPQQQQDSSVTPTVGAVMSSGGSGGEQHACLTAHLGVQIPVLAPRVAGAQAVLMPTGMAFTWPGACPRAGGHALTAGSSHPHHHAGHVTPSAASSPRAAPRHGTSPASDAVPPGHAPHTRSQPPRTSQPAPPQLAALPSPAGQLVGPDAAAAGTLGAGGAVGTVSSWIHSMVLLQLMPDGTLQQVLVDPGGTLPAPHPGGAAGLHGVAGLPGRHNPVLDQAPQHQHQPLVEPAAHGPGAHGTATAAKQGAWHAPFALTQATTGFSAPSVPMLQPGSPAAPSVPVPAPSPPQLPPSMMAAASECKPAVAGAAGLDSSASGHREAGITAGPGGCVHTMRSQEAVGEPTLAACNGLQQQGLDASARSIQQAKPEDLMLVTLPDGTQAMVPRVALLPPPSFMVLPPLATITPGGEV